MRNLTILMTVALTINFCVLAAEPKPSASPVTPAPSAPGGPEIERGHSAVGAALSHISQPGAMGADPKPSAPPASVPYVDPEIKRRHDSLALAASAALSQELQPGAPVARAIGEEEEEKSCAGSCGIGPSKAWNPVAQTFRFGQEIRPEHTILIDRSPVAYGDKSKRAWYFKDREDYDLFRAFSREGLWHNNNHCNRAISLVQGNLLQLSQWTNPIPGKIDASTGKLCGAQLGSLLKVSLPGYRSSEIFCATNADISSFLTYDRDLCATVLYRITKAAQDKIDIERLSYKACGDNIPLRFRSNGKSFIALGLTSATLYDCDPAEVLVRAFHRNTYELCLKGEQINRALLVCEGLGLAAQITTSAGRTITIDANNAEYVFGPLKE